VTEERPFDLVDGQGDPPLDPAGEHQAQLIAERLSADPISAIYVSNLCRTAQTAAPLAARLGIEPTVDSDFREVHLGEWEGGLYRIRVTEGDPLYHRMVAEQRWDVIPGAEPDADFAARVSAALERVRIAHPGELVAVFCHGGVIAKAMALATGSRPFAFLTADNGSITHLVLDGDRTVVRAFNDCAHLRRGFFVEPANRRPA
jgi:probable phosphoglycerate mutase